MPQTTVARAMAMAVIIASGSAAPGCRGVSSVSPAAPTSTPSPTPVLLVPDRIDAGSADLAIDIVGSGFCCEAGSEHSQAVWTVDDVSVNLDTRFVSGDRLTAFVPAALLGVPRTAHVVVKTKIHKPDDERVVQTAPATFVVLAPKGSPLAIAPSSAKAGSPDLQLTITGSGFRNAGNHNKSWVVWNAGDTSTRLNTTFVSVRQLVAVVPASLLATPLTAQVRVWTGDPMDEAAPSAIADFQVTAQ